MVAPVHIEPLLGMVLYMIGKALARNCMRDIVSQRSQYQLAVHERQMNRSLARQDTQQQLANLHCPAELHISALTRPQ